MVAFCTPEKVSMFLPSATFCLTSQETPVSLGENAREEGMGLALWLWLMGNKQV